MSAEVGKQRHTVIYIDPEAKPSPDLVAHFQDEGIDIKWICDYRELDPRQNLQRFNAVIVDMSSSDPQDFMQRVQEARSLDLTIPSIAIIPPFTGRAMEKLRAEGMVHHWLERPFDQDELLGDTIKFINESLAQEAEDGTTTRNPNLQIDVLDVLMGGGSLETVEASEVFADILDDPDADRGVVPQFKSESLAKVGVAHEYRSMREVTMADLKPVAEEMQNYVLEEHVATGGMAELFKARLRGAEGFARTVAIKRILPVRADDEDFVAMFIDEARLASSLDHPNIVRTLDFGKCKTSSGADTYFIALDFVEGKDLNWIIKRVRERGLCIPEPIITFIAAKMASALQYLHTRTFPNGQPMGLVHRDVSPHNIMLSKQGGVVIVDFGVIKAATKINQTLDGNLKGKLIYMSPEQASGEDLDGRSDLFSLGLVIHEGLTMKRAYSKANAKAEHQILKLAQNALVPPMRQWNPYVTTGIEEIVVKAVQKKPGNRFADALAMEKALKAHMRTLPDRVEDSDVAEFLAAVLEKDPSVLKNLIQSRYPATMDFAAKNALEHISGVTKKSEEKVPEAQPKKKARKVDVAFIWVCGVLLGLLVTALAVIQYAKLHHR